MSIRRDPVTGSAIAPVEHAAIHLTLGRRARGGRDERSGEEDGPDGQRDPVFDGVSHVGGRERKLQRMVHRFRQRGRGRVSDRRETTAGVQSGFGIHPSSCYALGILDPRQYAAEAVLRDGGSIHIRAIRPDDRERLLDHFHRLSARSVYFRFFGAKRRLTNAELDQFTRLDFDRRVALVATLFEHGEERIIGVGRYAVVDERSHSAEVAFAVADAHQGRGIGTVLLEHLTTIARARGVTDFEADVLGENNQMLQVFAATGFVVKSSTQAGVVHMSFPTGETERSRELALARELHAAAESIRTLLHPHSVAVIGASRDPRTIGGALIANLRAAGFEGPIYPVNPKVAEIQGLPAAPSVTAIGKPVDLAVVAVPA